jgi:16S rRNA (cytosine1402-N4)-methyltransferase
VVLDIGVSSMQLDQRERGFAFSSDGPLDMRMSQDGMSAADFLNEADEAAIADVLYVYGEERQSRRVARAVVAARPLTTTGQFAAVVRKALGYRPGAAKDPATRSFQAVRIHVNGELDELRAALDAAERLLAPGGRLAVVSFHSLEDRIVKQFLREAAGALPSGSRHLPPQAQAFAAVFEKPSAAIRPGAEEEARNPRARSATLRWAVRTTAPARAFSQSAGANRHDPVCPTPAVDRLAGAACGVRRAGDDPVFPGQCPAQPGAPRRRADRGAQAAEDVP